MAKIIGIKIRSFFKQIRRFSILTWRSIINILLNLLYANTMLQFLLLISITITILFTTITSLLNLLLDFL